MEVLAAFLTLLAGVSLGVLGGGGSILTVPILLYVLGMEPREAIGTSLVVVGTTSMVAALQHARAGAVRWKGGLLFGVAGVIGAAGGGLVGEAIPSPILLGAFGAMVVTTALAMLRPKRAGIDSLPAAPSVGRMLGVGLGVGALTGLVGAGGGFLIVPALAVMGGFPMPAAIATSLLVIAMNSLTGFVGVTLAGTEVQLGLAALLSAFSILGSFVGARIGRRIHPDGLRRLFALFVLALGAFILIRESWPLFAPIGGRLNMSVYLPALLGGILIGLAAAFLLLTLGRTAGISGIAGELLALPKGETVWRAAFIAGLIGGGVILRMVLPTAFGGPVTSSPLLLIVAGLLVGFGTRLGNGCTSGHGICGIGRGSPRGIGATLIFMATGALTVFIVRQLGGLS